MNLVKIITATAGAVVVGKTVVDLRKITLAERKKREQIRLNSEKELAAIRRASEIVTSKIYAGHYDQSPNVIEAMFVDSQFYRIAARFED